MSFVIIKPSQSIVSLVYSIIGHVIWQSTPDVPIDWGSVTCRRLTGRHRPLLFSRCPLIPVHGRAASFPHLYCFHDPALIGQLFSVRVTLECFPSTLRFSHLQFGNCWFHVFVSCLFCSWSRLSFWCFFLTGFLMPMSPVSLKYMFYCMSDWVFYTHACSFGQSCL